MKRKVLRFGEGFRVMFGNRRAQAAEMTLAAGAAEGGPGNRHRGSDQWLFVLSGAGVAVVNNTRYPLRAGTLLLTEHGDTHASRSATVPTAARGPAPGARSSCGLAAAPDTCP
jgi:mannose-6-phosphate isomerase-like protein (cupin superfamily)